MIQKIVFFISWPLNKRDFTRFGADLLAKNGFEVCFYDFSDLLYPGLGRATIPDRIDSDRYPRFKERHAAVSAISALDEKCFVVVMFDFDKEACWIYQALSRIFLNI